VGLHCHEPRNIMGTASMRDRAARNCKFESSDLRPTSRANLQSAARSV
jgi:hypothetical protein